MSFFTGRDGSIQISGSGALLKVRDWSLDTTVELLSTTVLGDHANNFHPGLKGATGSATLLYYKKETGDTGTEFTTLLNRVQFIGEVTPAADVELILKVGTSVLDDIRFAAFITSASISVSTTELTTVAFNFTMTGDFLEFINPTA